MCVCFILSDEPLSDEGHRYSFIQSTQMIAFGKYMLLSFLWLISVNLLGNAMAINGLQHLSDSLFAGVNNIRNTIFLNGHVLFLDGSLNLQGRCIQRGR